MLDDDVQFAVIADLDEQFVQPFHLFQRQLDEVQVVGELDIAWRFLAAHKVSSHLQGSIPVDLMAGCDLFFCKYL